MKIRTDHKTQFCSRLETLNRIAGENIPESKAREKVLLALSDMRTCSTLLDDSAEKQKSFIKACSPVTNTADPHELTCSAFFSRTWTRLIRENLCGPMTHGFDIDRMIELLFKASALGKDEASRLRLFGADMPILFYDAGRNSGSFGSLRDSLRQIYSSDWHRQRPDYFSLVDVIFEGNIENPLKNFNKREKYHIFLGQVYPSDMIGIDIRNNDRDLEYMAERWLAGTNAVLPDELFQKIKNGYYGACLIHETRHVNQQNGGELDLYSAMDMDNLKNHENTGTPNIIEFRNPSVLISWDVGPGNLAYEADAEYEGQNYFAGQLFEIEIPLWTKACYLQKGYWDYKMFSRWLSRDIGARQEHEETRRSLASKWNGFGKRIKEIAPAVGKIYFADKCIDIIGRAKRKIEFLTGANDSHPEVKSPPKKAVILYPRFHDRLFKKGEEA